MTSVRRAPAAGRYGELLSRVLGTHREA